jgi:hypothetical protein
MIYFNYKLLKEYSLKNNILLTKDYKDENVDRLTIIEGKCCSTNCKEHFKKTFLLLYKKSGPYCRKCTIKNTFNKQQKQNYTLDVLYEHIHKNNILSIGEINNNISQNSIIEAKCSNYDCHGSFSKTFRQIVNETGTKCSSCISKICVESRKDTRFDYDLLKKYVKDNEIELLELYDDVDVNCYTIIKGKCKTDNCDNSFSRVFRLMYYKQGPYCVKCTKSKNKSNNICRYDFNYLDDYVKKNNIILLHDYKNTIVNSNTIINGKCITLNCNEEFSKIFRQMCLGTGAYCKICSTKISLSKTKITNKIKKNAYFVN